MKIRVLIVEDDKFFRFAIKKYINWSKYGFDLIGEAVHGEAALQFLENNEAEIVITDMSMPVMDGIAFTAAAKAKFPQIMIIALSAYDEFEFVKESMKLGASDYLLKQDIEKEDFGQSIRNSWDKYLAKLLKDSQLGLEIKDFLNGDSDNQNAEKYLQMCLAGTGGYYLCLIRNLNPSWNNWGNTDLLTGSLLELHDQNEHIIFFQGNSHSSFQTQMECRLGKRNEIENNLKSEGYLGGCSGLETDAGNVQQCYMQAARAARTGAFVKRFRIQLWDEVRMLYETREEEFLEPVDSYADISTVADAGTALAELTQKLCQQMPDEEFVQKNYLLYLSTVAANVHYEIEKNAYAAIREQLAKSSLLIKKQEIVQYYLTEIFDAGQDMPFHSGVVNSIQYMRQNYNKDITLHDIAMYSALNESYLSNLFKKETGQGIIEYLNTIRIEKAKELIQNTNEKNYEIARNVGIFNASYFSTLFKKETGVTVQEYRHQILNTKILNEI